VTSNAIASVASVLTTQATGSSTSTMTRGRVTKDSNAVGSTTPSSAIAIPQTDATIIAMKKFFSSRAGQ